MTTGASECSLQGYRGEYYAAWAQGQRYRLSGRLVGVVAGVDVVAGVGVESSMHYPAAVGNNSASDGQGLIREPGLRFTLGLICVVAVHAFTQQQRGPSRQVTASGLIREPGLRFTSGHLCVTEAKKSSAFILETTF